MRGIVLWLGLGVLTACKDKAEVPAPTAATPTEARAPALGVEVPAITGAGAMPADKALPVIAVAPSSLALAGKQLVSLREGKVPTEELDGPAIRKLTQALAALPASTDTLAIALDQRLTYEALLTTAHSATSAQKRFVLLARAKDEVVALPMTLPDRKPSLLAPGGQPGAAPSEQALKMVLSLTETDVTLWSFSGLEGTVSEPLLRVPHSDPAAFAKVGDKLAEIVRRRWDGRPRPDGSGEIILLAPGSTPIRLIADAAGTVRATPAGVSLFPDVLLAAGFEETPAKPVEKPVDDQAEQPADEPAQASSHERIAVLEKQAFDDVSLTAETVVRRIQAVYMAGVKRCYRTVLANDGSARGRVRLQISVDEAGRSHNSTAKTFATELDECITGLMSTWRFPLPKDKDGEATEASFAIMLQLTPD